MNADVVKGHQNDHCTNPGGDFCKINAVLSQPDRQQQRTADAHGQFRNARYHGNDRVSHSLKGGAVQMQQIQHRQQAAHNEQIGISDVQHLRNFTGFTGNEQQQHRFSKRNHGRGNYHRSGNRHFQSGAHSLANAAVFFRSQILPCIGGHGKAKGGCGQLQQAVQLVGGGKTGYKQESEPVDDELYHQSAHRNDRILKRHGQAQLKQPAAETAIRMPVGFGHTENRHAPEHSQTEQAGTALGNDRCSGGAGNAPVEAHDKQQVQPDVDHGSHQHGVQRGSAVAHGPENGGHHVVSRYNDGAGKNDSQIGKGAGQHVVRRVQQPQHRFRQQQTGNGHHHGDDGGKQRAHGGDFPKAVLIFCAESLGNQDGKALSKAHNDAQYQPVEPIRSSKGSQRFYAQHLSHHHGVHHGIQLLADVACHQRQGKG